MALPALHLSSVKNDTVVEMDTALEQALATKKTQTIRIPADNKMHTKEHAMERIDIKHLIKNM